jgi:hypothetical protein
MDDVLDVMVDGLRVMCRKAVQEKMPHAPAAKFMEDGDIVLHMPGMDWHVRKEDRDAIGDLIKLPRPCKGPWHNVPTNRYQVCIDCCAQRPYIGPIL